MTRDQLQKRLAALNLSAWALGDEVIRTFDQGGSFGPVVRQLKLLRVKREALLRKANKAAMREERRAVN